VEIIEKDNVVFLRFHLLYL